MPFTKDLDPERIFETTAGRKACKRLLKLSREQKIKNEPFSQRIIMRIRLRELSAEEVAPYLYFRLKHAGRTAKLFMPDAIQAITKASRGVPRLIDRIAEHCLPIALERKAKVIDTQIVNLAQEEMES